MMAIHESILQIYPNVCAVVTTYLANCFSCFPCCTGFGKVRWRSGAAWCYKMDCSNYFVILIMNSSVVPSLGTSLLLLQPKKLDRGTTLNSKHGGNGWGCFLEYMLMCTQHIPLFAAHCTLTACKMSGDYSSSFICKSPEEEKLLNNMQK